MIREIVVIRCDYQRIVVIRCDFPTDLKGKKVLPVWLLLSKRNYLTGQSFLSFRFSALFRTQCICFRKSAFAYRQFLQPLF